MIRTLEFYKDEAGEFRWRLIAHNGNILATSSEGYKNRADCESIAESIFFNKAEPEVSVLW
jgi:uncharacterized protein YegP (UPF0339 family)